MTRLRIGYVGAGFMAQKVHLPNLGLIDEVELIALAEARPRLGEKGARPVSHTASLPSHH